MYSARLIILVTTIHGMITTTGLRQDIRRDESGKLGQQLFVLELIRQAIGILNSPGHRPTACIDLAFDEKHTVLKNIPKRSRGFISLLAGLCPLGHLASYY